MTTNHLTPGILGWYATTANSTSSATDLGSMKEGLRTTLPFSESTTHSNAVAATGDTFCFGDSGLVATVGSPIWSDAILHDLSESMGPAKALAQAYLQHGRQFTDKMSGNFSFAIIDPLKNLCFIGTDSLARYPLYYTKTDTGLVVFASTASALYSHPDVDRQICSQGIYNYTYFHMVPSPTSIYQGISKLSAGCFLEASAGGLKTPNYYTPVFKSKPEKGFKALSKDLRKVLKAAVEKQISKSGQTGAFLSGGLDSSTVVGMLAEVSGPKAKAFSIGFSADGYDEMAYARITAKHFGVKLHEYYVTPEDVVEALPKVAISYDEPFGNSSALPAYFCAKLAHENGTEHLLAGDGGDELFAGNERYAKQTIFEAYNYSPNWVRSTLIEPIIKVLPEKLSIFNKIKSYIDQAKVPLPDRMQNYNFLHQHDPSEIFSANFLAEVDSEIPLIYQRELYNRPKDASQLNRMLYLDWQYTLADNDLRKVSHMCAMAGVRVSYPMLDDELVEFSCGIPDKWKLNGQKLRHFYKESLRGWLPDETINKKKQGFGLPFGIWMQTHKPLQELAYDSLTKLKSRRYFNSQFLDQVIELHRHGHASYYGELVWILTVLEIWMEEHSSE